jgi:hypothetical protein
MEEEFLTPEEKRGPTVLRTPQPVEKLQITSSLYLRPTKSERK